MGRVLSRMALLRTVRSIKHRGKRIVFTNGCFEIIHVGHLRVLRKAKELGHVLVVAINSDASVRKLKGRSHPIITARERAEILASLEPVDFVTVFTELTPERIISEVKPDVLVKGGDWRKDEIVGRDIVEARGGRVVRIPLIRGHSTTRILQKINRDSAHLFIFTRPAPRHCS